MSGSKGSGAGGRGGTGGRGGRRATGAWLGRQGEQAAERRLEEQGYRTVQRNYRCRLGEVDVIAYDGDTLCFVEVKARRTGAYGSGLEAVDGRKRGRLKRAAGWYLARFGATPPPCRFDVVEVLLDPDGRPGQVRLVRNAFT